MASQRIESSLKVEKTECHKNIRLVMLSVMHDENVYALLRPTEAAVTDNSQNLDCPQPKSKQTNKQKKPENRKKTGGQDL